MPRHKRTRSSSARGRAVKRFNRGRTFRTVRRRVPAAPRGLSNMRRMIKNVQILNYPQKYPARIVVKFLLLNIKLKQVNVN